MKLSFLLDSRFIAQLNLKKAIKRNSHIIKGKVLDVGCGNKPYKKLFNYKEYIGLDTNNSGHNHKNEKIDVFYDGKFFPFKKESFDSVVSFEVWEHVKDLDLMMKEIRRVLKKEGVLLVTFPFIWNLHEEPYDFRRLTPYGLNDLLEKNKFKIIKIEKIGSNFSSLFMIKNLYFEEIYLKIRKPFRYLIYPIFIINNMIGLSLSFIKTEKIFQGVLVIAKK